MKLSVIVISYDMAREIPRTLQGLARDYQMGAKELEYEVLLVDNGSPEPLDPASWAHIDVPVTLIRPENPATSPAPAINEALAMARGELLCLMIDGAHVLTPGVFQKALDSFAAFGEAVVAVRYFYLGMEEQTISIDKGYNQAAEDKLMERIDWPSDGYRLFEIATPLRAGAPRLNWFNRMFEANCLFMKRALFEEQGGADERYDFPGGGFLNLDVFKKAVEAPGVTPVQIIGEGCFHQFHGGTTTNSSGQARDEKLAKYRAQFEEITGSTEVVSKVDFCYLGNMLTMASNITAVERRRAKLAGKPLD
ncbi:MAG: glycosyltransferase family 2 protein [Halioglobus sp.]